MASLLEALRHGQFLPGLPHIGDLFRWERAVGISSLVHEAVQSKVTVVDFLQMEPAQVQQFRQDVQNAGGVISIIVASSTRNGEFTQAVLTQPHEAPVLIFGDQPEQAQQHLLALKDEGAFYVVRTHNSLNPATKTTMKNGQFDLAAGWNDFVNILKLAGVTGANIFGYGKLRSNANGWPIPSEAEYVRERLRDGRIEAKSYRVDTNLESIYQVPR